VFRSHQMVSLKVNGSDKLRRSLAELHEALSHANAGRL